MTAWTCERYAWLRIALGTYLVIHFLELLPWASELFGSDGMLPDASASPIAHAFPNPLALVSSPGVVIAMVAAGAVLSVLLLIGRFDRIAAVGIWFVWACLFGRNPLISSPSLPYVGLLLIAHACLDPTRPDWRMPKRMHGALWIAMAAGYTYSGLTKLGSPSWVDGSAVTWVLENPLARPTALRELLLGLPDWMLAGITWLTLALEAAFAPLALVRRARPWIWAAMLSMHVTLLVLIDFADLTMGMVLLHAFTFDPAWLDGVGKQSNETVDNHRPHGILTTDRMNSLCLLFAQAPESRPRSVSSPRTSTPRPIGF